MQIRLPQFLTRTYFEDPLRSYRFLVEVDGAAVGAFSKFSGIEMEVHTIQARSGSDLRGVQDYIPVLTSYSPATLSKGVIGGYPFLDWLSAASASPHIGPTGSRLRRNVNVIALDDGGHRGVIWTLYDAMPTGYSVTPLDSLQSEVLTESLTFVYTGMERTVGPLSFLA